MRYTTFGTTDLRVSTICLGTWQGGGDWGAVDPTSYQEIFGAALDAGINFFDTAQAYGFGASERLVGEGLAPVLRSRRDEIVLATKGGLRLEGGQLLRDASPQWLRSGLEDSLRYLGVDHIDLYQLHWPVYDRPLEEVAQTLQSFVDEGKVRYVGVSNCTVEEMDAFRRGGTLHALQPAYHLFRREIERDALPYCRDNGIGVLVYGPLAHGLATGVLSERTTFADGDWRAGHPVFQGESYRANLRAVDELHSVAERLGVTLPQLAVAWTLAHPAVDSSIIGTTRARHVTDTAKAADLDLDQQVFDEIDRILGGAVPVGGPAPEAV